MILAAAHDLARALGDVRHAAGEAGLAEAELSAVRVAGEVTLEREVVFADEGLALAARAEAGVFDGHQDGDRVAVVDRDQVDFLARAAGHVEGLVGGRYQGRGEQVFRVGRGLVQDALAEA